MADEAVELADEADLDEAEAWEAWGTSTPGGPHLGGGLVEGRAEVILPSEVSRSPLQSTLAAEAEVVRQRRSLALAAQEAAVALARQGAREDAVHARSALEDEARTAAAKFFLLEDEARVNQAAAATAQQFLQQELQEDMEAMMRQANLRPNPKPQPRPRPQPRPQPQPRSRWSYYFTCVCVCVCMAGGARGGGV